MCSYMYVQQSSLMVTYAVKCAVMFTRLINGETCALKFVTEVKLQSSLNIKILTIQPFY